MQRTALVIIGLVLILAGGGGYAFFKWKQQQQPSQTSPLIPIVETTPIPAETPTPTETPEPAPSETPAAPAETPVASEPPSATESPATPAPQRTINTVPEALHIRGGTKAKVTLEEYGDFQCAPCGRVYPILKAIEHDYGDRLRVVFRHMPITRHEHAPLAARAAEAAGLQGKFWEMHDLLFENSSRWTKGIDATEPEPSPSRRFLSPVLAMDIEVRDVFAHYAELLNLDVDRFKQDLDSDVLKARVESDRSRGAGQGIDRTPTIYVNGHIVPAPAVLTDEGLRAAIEAAIQGKVYVPPPTPVPAATPKAVTK